jgi:signal transduction histidine kinase/CheY-like chemotaxis protein
MERFKHFFKFLIREELEIQHRLMNIILSVGVFALIVCMLFDFVVGTGARTYWILLLLIFCFLLSLYLANALNKPNAAGVVLSVVCNYFLMPILFFAEGGKESAMPMWLMLGALFTWLIVRGWVVVLIYAGNMAVCAAVLMADYYHPELVSRMTDRKAEYFDYMFAVAGVVLVFGIIFKFQSRIYEQKRKELEQKESELIEVNLNLEKANEAKTTFLARMSHEIRTPINAVIGMNEMILRESSEWDIVNYAQSIETASHTLLALINDILDFSKIESGQMRIIPEEYELYSLLNDCYSMLEMRAKDKGLTFKLDYNKDIPSGLLGDEIRIRQIITNLLTNAVKYTDAGSITFKVDYNKKNDEEINLVVSVADTGRGISKEGLEEIFESFKRADERQNRNIEGTGHGLAITRQLTDLMNGSINVESEKGRGSVFTVTIPQKVVSGEPLGAITERVDEKSRTGINYRESFKAPDARILVVDDVPVNYKIVKLLLKNTGIQIVTAESGRECLEKYNSDHYDIVLLDHMMPEMDGIETLREIKKLEKYTKEHTPVIALTANAIQGAQKEYIDAGFDDYLTKPVQGADLERMIVRYLPKELINK